MTASPIATGLRTGYTSPLRFYPASYFSDLRARAVFLVWCVRFKRGIGNHPLHTKQVLFRLRMRSAFHVV
jgi:hypothetical protein